MIVDDVIFNIDILKDILEKVLKVDVKNDVIEAYNGKQAVQKYVQMMKRNKG